jgi:predicted membrane protein
VEQLPMENRGFVSSMGSLAWGINVIIVAGIGYLMRNVSWRYVHMASGLVGVHVIASFW